MVNFRLLSWFWNIQSWKMASQINSLNMASKSSEVCVVQLHNSLKWAPSDFLLPTPKMDIFRELRETLGTLFCVSTLFISRDSWCRFWRHFLKIKGHFNLFHRVWKITFKKVWIFISKLDFFKVIFLERLLLLCDQINIFNDDRGEKKVTWKWNMKLEGTTQGRMAHSCDSGSSS